MGDSSMKQAVDSFGSEGLRIVSLVIGFSIVQLVLLLAAFRSRRQNVNHLIAFVFVFTGVSGLLVACLTTIKDRLSKQTGPYGDTIARVTVGCIVALFAGMVIIGFCFYYSVIRIPFGQVAVSREVKAGTYADRLRTIASINDSSRILNLEELYSRGYTWFIDFETSKDVEKNMEFIVSHPDAIFFAVGASRDNLATPPNLFRLMNRDADQIEGAGCMSGKQMHVARSIKQINAMEKGSALFLDVDTPTLNKIAASNIEIKGDIWISQSAAYDNPTTETWEFLKKHNARMIVSQTSAMVPFETLSSIMIEEAMLLIYESILSKQEELKTHVDIIKFISESKEIVPFDNNGDRISENKMLQVKVSSNNKWMFEKKVVCANKAAH